MRTAELERSTNETRITCSISLDGTGKSLIDTGVGFFNHMLTLMAFHGGFDLTLTADGDLDVDDHHTIEDCGIVLGSVFKEALGDRRGINRYGSFTLPMDETLCNVTLDISGRPISVCHCKLDRDTVGMMSTEMVPEFLRAFANAAGITLHVNVYYGENDHHRIEAIFKALGHALKEAVKITGDGVMSTKGMLEE
ncbi:MAG: imidazoleglycerol-phosphate dehydratase HisB [Erysipelotrichia bacterium]|nr:imidazoleglycerol-phosphate dehydratase HisB [Erysipelotrichia bacterium]